MPATVKPLTLSGWYEHVDGSWGFYTWDVGDGIITLALAITVRTQAETAGPPPERLRAMREHFAGRGDQQGEAWCTLALHGHDVAIAKVIELERSLMAELAAEIENSVAEVLAAPQQPLPAVQIIERCPHGTMPREAGAGHWRDWHRGHGCHLDPTRGTKP